MVVDMRYFFSFIVAFLFLTQNSRGNELMPLNNIKYQKIVLEKIGSQLNQLSFSHVFQYPNKDFEILFNQSPDSKVLLFGYGSLMNKQSASCNIKSEAIATMEPAIAFGVKRIFNYQAKKTDHWGLDLDRKEKAMLNLVPSWDIKSAINGVVIEIDQEDLASLIKREVGYDLVPILVASWNSIIGEDPHIDIKVAYTFVAPHEAREGVLYTSTQYYPVTNYLLAVQEGAYDYGSLFFDFWNTTTFLADGKTTIKDWDTKTFTGILCSKNAIS